MRCLDCGSEAVTERSERTAQGYRRFRCRARGKQFNERSSTLLNRAQYPSDVIALVVLWRLRYKLSLRDLPEMFAVRGIVFSHEAVREWEAKLTPALAEDLRRRRTTGEATSAAGSLRWLQRSKRALWRHAICPRSGRDRKKTAMKRKLLTWTRISEGGSASRAPPLARCRGLRARAAGRCRRWGARVSGERSGRRASPLRRTDQPFVIFPLEVTGSNPCAFRRSRPSRLSLPLPLRSTRLPAIEERHSRL
jgi:hypothetical protein